MWNASAGRATTARIANRGKREVIARVPAFSRMEEARHERRARRYRPSLPSLTRLDRVIVNELNEHAVHLTRLDVVGLPGTDRLLGALEPLVASLAARPASGASTLRPTRDELLADPVIWQWGLSGRLLDIVEAYLGVPARYYGADLRREAPDGRLDGVRRWHLDTEDRRMVKLLVWLADVDLDGGPYTYVPLPSSPEAVRELRYVSGFVTDERMRQVVHERRWRYCPGPGGTALFADNTRVLHRAAPPVSRDRYSLTFTWSTRHPAKTIPAEPFSPEHVQRIAGGLDARQLACLSPAMTRPRPTGRARRILAGSH